ncbi:MAG: hypothetical protein JW751_22695 [Polyangiaceae bacterium]|nr:hypothetical protein [Polyangiaceae bacterium]
MGRWRDMCAVGWLLFALSTLGCRENEVRRSPPVNRPHRIAPTAPRSAAAASASATVHAPPESASAAMSEAMAPPGPCGTSDRGETLTTGQRVLVVPIRANYLVARVKVSGQDEVRVESPTGNTFSIERARIYPLDRHQAEGDVAGCYGGCKLGDLWVACRVLSGNHERVRVEDHAGVEHSLPRAEAVVFDRALQLQVRQFFVETRRRDAFRDALAEAGRPAPPPGYRPVLGEVVLVDSGPKYLTAEVVGVLPHGCKVRWFGHVRTPSDRPLADLLPFPRAGFSLGETAIPGEFVLAKGRDDHGADRLHLTSDGKLADPASPPPQSFEWQAYRVVAVSEAGTLVVADRDGRQKTERASETFRYMR